MTDENTEPKTAGTEPTVPDWLLPNRAYDVLKWLALIVLPAIGVLVQTLGPVWGWTCRSGRDDHQRRRPGHRRRHRRKHPQGQGIQNRITIKTPPLHPA